MSIEPLRIIFGSIIMNDFKKTESVCTNRISEHTDCTMDKHLAYPVAITKLKKEKKVPLGTQIRQINYLNNVVEQVHRFIKKCICSILEITSFRTATCILAGVDAMHMKKEQVDLQDQSVQNQKEFIHQLFGLTA
ncbi:transposase [Bacillus thuringiensis]|nr:transposase [Bacillus thuringiensis]